MVALGHTFRTKSDTEVIVHAWEAWGAACVERFRGMFAFALWDRNRATLFLARDRLGVKPLHYALLADGTFVFGSELKSLLAHPAFVREIDPLAVEEYFALGYVPEPRTIFKGARKLPPAHTLSLRMGAPVGRTDAVLGPALHARPASSAWTMRWRSSTARLDESVRLRMISEVPLGAFLSGGVDSSAVVASMAASSPAPVNTCSIAFADPAYDESRFALDVAQRYRTRHFVDRVESDDFDLIDTLARAVRRALCRQLGHSHLPSVPACAQARHRRALGRRRRREFRRLSALPSAPRGRAAAAGAAARAAAPDVRTARPGLPQGRLGATDVPREDRRSRRSAAIRSTRTSKACRFCATACAASSSPSRSAQSSPATTRSKCSAATHSLAQTEDPLALIQYLDLKTYLIGDINTKVDRASMAHSLEVREPLMDHPLVEWLASLPSSLKINGTEGKWLLKKAMEPRLPRDVLYRPKMGFAVPLTRWFRGPLRERVREALLGDRLADTGIFERNYLRRLVDQHQTGRRDYSAPLWSLLMFDAFLRNVAERPAEAGLRAKAA